MIWQEWLGVTGNIASIAGLVVSAFVLIAVRRLRQRFGRQGMIELCLAILQRSRDKLNTGIEERNSDAIRGALAQIRAAAGRLRLHVSDEPSVEWSLDDIDNAIRADGRSIYSMARKLLPQVEHWIAIRELRLREMMWGKDDG